MIRKTTVPEQRQQKPNRHEFPKLPRLPLVIVLDGVSGAPNFGTVIRLADGLRAEKIYLCNSTIKHLSVAVKRVAKGRAKWTPWEQRDDTAEVLRELQSDGYQCLGVELTNQSVPYTQFQPQGKVALVFGNESQGMSDGALRACDGFLMIPMHGMGNSLNVSMSCAIVSYHVADLLRKLKLGEEA